MSLVVELLYVSMCAISTYLKMCFSHVFNCVYMFQLWSCQRLLGDQSVDPQLQLLLRGSQQLRRSGGLHRNTATTQKCHSEGHGEAPVAWKRGRAVQTRNASAQT